MRSLGSCSGRWPRVLRAARILAPEPQTLSIEQRANDVPKSTNMYIRLMSICMCATAAAAVPSRRHCGIAVARAHWPNRTRSAGHIIRLFCLASSSSCCHRNLLATPGSKMGWKRGDRRALPFGATSESARLAKPIYALFACP